jgi:hypothetical protein
MTYLEILKPKWYSSKQSFNSMAEKSPTIQQKTYSSKPENKSQSLSVLVAETKVTKTQRPAADVTAVVKTKKVTFAENLVSVSNTASKAKRPMTPTHSVNVSIYSSHTNSSNTLAALMIPSVKNATKAPGVFIPSIKKIAAKSEIQNSTGI